MKEYRKDRQYGLYFEVGLVQRKGNLALERRCFWKNIVLPCSSTFLLNWRFGSISAEGEEKQTREQGAAG